jgi:hypothetical protein
VSLVLDQESRSPELPPADERLPLAVERDPRPLRGTGGVLRDLSARYDTDDFLLVANAGQLILWPLQEIVESMAATGSDVCVVSHRDGTPSGLMLVRCACLRQIPELGYVDMKEQALPEISKRFRSSVVYRDVPTGAPVRTARGYIRALKFHHGARSEERLLDPFAEDWETSFRIVEDGATVEPEAHLHDSVVLRGATVRRNALVARSIICSQGVVSADRRVVDSLVAARC